MKNGRAINWYLAAALLLTGCQTADVRTSRANSDPKSIATNLLYSGSSSIEMVSYENQSMRFQRSLDECDAELKQVLAKWLMLKRRQAQNDYPKPVRDQISLLLTLDPIIIDELAPTTVAYEKTEELGSFTTVTFTQREKETAITREMRGKITFMFCRHREKLLLHDVILEKSVKGERAWKASVEDFLSKRIRKAEALLGTSAN